MFETVKFPKDRVQALCSFLTVRIILQLEVKPREHVFSFLNGSDLVLCHVNLPAGDAPRCAMIDF